MIKYSLIKINDNNYKNGEYINAVDNQDSISLNDFKIVLINIG